MVSHLIEEVQEGAGETVISEDDLKWKSFADIGKNDEWDIFQFLVSSDLLTQILSPDDEIRFKESPPNESFFVTGREENMVIGRFKNSLKLLLNYLVCIGDENLFCHFSTLL
jgi:hypothetical protein